MRLRARAAVRPLPAHGLAPSEGAAVIRARLFGLLPAVAKSVAPPSEGGWDVLGVEEGELGAYGLNALTRRLGVIGVSLE
jgi:hypothetical protein